MEPDPNTGSVAIDWQVERPDVTSGMSVIDCHTHTYFSGDSSTPIPQYVEEFHRSGLTHVFVTDHQSISAYPLLLEQLGQRVICGQEQRVAEGEVIGLFLKEKLPPGMRLRDASRAIREQGGIVYLCHPLDRNRFSVGLDDLMTSVENGWIDAIELYNSKSASLNPKVAEIAAQYSIGLLGGSDSHVASAIGSSGAVMPSFTSAETFLESIKQAVPYGRHFDPPKSWPLQVVPSTQVFGRECLPF